MDVGGGSTGIRKLSVVDDQTELGIRSSKRLNKGKAKA